MPRKKLTLKEKILKRLGQSNATSAKLTQELGGKTKGTVSGLFVVLSKLVNTGEVTKVADPDKPRGMIYSLVKADTFESAINSPERVPGVLTLKIIPTASTAFDAWWQTNRIIRTSMVFAALPQAVIDFENEQKAIAYHYFQAGYEAK